MPPKKAKIIDDESEDMGDYGPRDESEQEDVYTDDGKVEDSASESDDAYGESDEEEAKPKKKQPAKKAAKGKATPAPAAPKAPAKKKASKVSVEIGTTPATKSAAPKKLPSMGGGVVIPSMFQQASAPRRVGMSRNTRVAPLHPYAS